MTAVMVGTVAQHADPCTYYDNAVIELDLTGNHVTGNVSGYASTGGLLACASVTGCTTVFSMVGDRM
jgi:hypothetical protein